MFHTASCCVSRFTQPRKNLFEQLLLLERGAGLPTNARSSRNLPGHIKSQLQTLFQRAAAATRSATALTARSGRARTRPLPQTPTPTPQPRRHPCPAQGWFANMGIYCLIVESKVAGIVGNLFYSAQAGNLGPSAQGILCSIAPTKLQDVHFKRARAFIIIISLKKSSWDFG